MYFWVHNCTSPSNDYVAVACSNNNQAQLCSCVSIPYWSLDVWLGLELLRDIQFGLPAILNNSLASYQSVATIITSLTCVVNVLTWQEVGVAVQKIFGCTSCINGWTPLSKFLDLPLASQRSRCCVVHGHRKQYQCMKRALANDQKWWPTMATKYIPWFAHFLGCCVDTVWSHLAFPNTIKSPSVGGWVQTCYLISKYFCLGLTSMW